MIPVFGFLNIKILQNQWVTWFFNRQKAAG